MEILRLREVKSPAQGHPLTDPGLNHGPNSFNFPSKFSLCPSQLQFSRQQEGRERKPALRINYLFCQGTETQEPVLSLLQGSRELTLTKLHGQSSLSDLAQVAGT
jgi:hypothetical protein